MSASALGAPAEVVRVAMWSGPRNISTAMMRAWENRGDCAVSDEPFYAHYLAETRLDHPARAGNRRRPRSAAANRSRTTRRTGRPAAAGRCRRR
jgi:hypothetical protein